MFNDGTSQTETADQFAYLYVPQDTNPDRPGHMLRFQARADGPGQVLLEVGGDYICRTYDKHETVVGSDDSPADKSETVSGDNVIQTTGTYVNMAQNHRLIADDIIQLLAGQDKQITDTDTGETSQSANPMCIVMWDPQRGLVASDRVFGTASPDAMQVTYAQVGPFTDNTADATDDTNETDDELDDTNETDDELDDTNDINDITED
jgi:hypothetical protein